MDDSEIIRLYWNRDEEAIFATAEKYAGYCTSIAKNICESSADAEECVNDTYLAAWNSIPPQKPSVLSAFLGRLARILQQNGVAERYLPFSTSCWKSCRIKKMLSKK